MKELLAKLTESDILWAVTFVGVCVLVGLGKMKPETLEMLLFAVIGRTSKKPRPTNPTVIIPVHGPNSSPTSLQIEADDGPMTLRNPFGLQGPQDASGEASVKERK